jgi:DNA-binding transcriptional LysR family regulator
MSLMMDDIRYFNVVINTLNLTRASEILGVAQPTLSYSIKRLEKELGGDLLIRLKNGVQLTKLGEDFAKQGRVVLFEWEQAQKLVENQRDVVSGKYSIGIHSSVALYSLEHFLPKLSRAHPGLEFSLKHGLSREIVEQVINWKIDFGMVVNPKNHLDLVIKELCKDKITLFSNGENHNTLLFEPNLNQTQTILKKLKKSSIVIEKKMTSESLEVIAKLTSLGVGIGVLPERVAKQQPNLKPLKNAPYFVDRICLVYRKEKQKSIASEAIISAILSAQI